MTTKMTLNGEELGTCMQCGQPTDSVKWTTCEFCADANIDKFYAGYDLRRAGKPRPTEKHAAAGWDDRDRACRVEVVMPARPEGYYHMPIGTFD